MGSCLPYGGGCGCNDGSTADDIDQMFYICENPVPEGAPKPVVSRVPRRCWVICATP